MEQPLVPLGVRAAAAEPVLDHQPSAGLEHAVRLPQERMLALHRCVADALLRPDDVEAAVREVHGREVHDPEIGEPGDLPLAGIAGGPFRLRRRQRDPGHVDLVMGGDPCSGPAVATSGVEDMPARLKAD